MADTEGLHTCSIGTLKESNTCLSTVRCTAATSGRKEFEHFWSIISCSKCHKPCSICVAPSSRNEFLQNAQRRSLRDTRLLQGRARLEVLIDAIDGKAELEVSPGSGNLCAEAGILCGRQAGHAEIPLDDQQAMLRLPFFRLAHCDPEEP